MSLGWTDPHFQLLSLVLLLWEGKEHPTIHSMHLLHSLYASIMSPFGHLWWNQKGVQGSWKEKCPFKSFYYLGREENLEGDLTTWSNFRSQSRRQSKSLAESSPRSCSTRSLGAYPVPSHGFLPVGLDRMPCSGLWASLTPDPDPDKRSRSIFSRANRFPQGLATRLRKSWQAGPTACVKMVWQNEDTSRRTPRSQYSEWDYNKYKLMIQLSRQIRLHSGKKMQGCLVTTI